MLVMGAVLLTAAAGEVAAAALARDRARSAWDQLTARQAVEAAELAVAPNRSLVAVRKGAPMARLMIPRLRLDEVVVEGVGDTDLRAGPGHLPGSAMPGDSGNAVISAHRDRHFRSLGALAIGDTVVTETLAGSTRWIVSKRTIVRRGAPALYSTAEPVLTLTTCWPIQALGAAPERLLFEARRIPGA
ncbi:MAG: class D sortase [Gemmatimonadaceae bacterium]